MRIFVNSADTSVLQPALTSGYIYGVTTNPTILRQDGVYARQVPALVKQMIDWGAHEVHLQTYADNTTEMTSEGRMLSAIDPERVVVRIPATPAGYAAAAQLVKLDIRIEMVAVYTLRQVLLAESVGASSAAVYLGRMRDTGIDGLSLIAQMQQLLNAQYSEVTLLVGSIREPTQVETLGLQGVQAVTVPPMVLDQLFDSAATLRAAEGFRTDSDAITDQMFGVGGH